MKYLLREKKGEILVFLSTLGFGAMGVLARGVYAYHYPVLSTLSIRFLFATISMAFYMKWSGTSFRVSLDEFKLLLLLGIIGYSNFSILYFAGVKYTGAAIVALVFSGFPVFIAIFSKLIYKKPIGKKKSFFLFTSLLALVFLTGKHTHNVNVFGVFLSLTGSFFYAIYTMFLEHPKVKKIDPVVASFYIIFLTTITLFLHSLIQGQLLLPSNFQILWRLLTLGIFSTSFAILTYYMGVQYLGAIKASIMSNFEAVVSVFLAILFLGERLSLLQWFGAILMIVSIVFVTILKE